MPGIQSFTINIFIFIAKDSIKTGPSASPVIARKIMDEVKNWIFGEAPLTAHRLRAIYMTLGIARKGP